MKENDDFESYSQRILRLGLSQPNKAACIFQVRGPETAIKISYGDLRNRVLDRASLFANRGLRGERAALIFATGIEFVIDFLACLHSGVVAVPLNLSRNPQQFSRALSVLEDAEISAVLTTSDVIEYVKQAVNGAKLSSSQYQWLTELEPSSKTETTSDVHGYETAFIQFTSGSTSEPKGVMVSQANIIRNQEAIRWACGHRDGLIGGGWLPQFHDMGLIGHMLQPLYLGGTYVFMPPMSFIQRPRRWLELISQFKIESSAAPNFGYEHCVRCISAKEDLSGLDLSCWIVASNGSEPVSSDTMEEFSRKFSPFGFRASAFFPCYGMAETTLFVSGGPAGNGATHQVLNEKDFLQGIATRATRGKVVVSCGRVDHTYDIRIVDPATHLECGKGVIGEIWLSGSSVAQGYWRRPKVNKEVFGAEIVGKPDRRYLRTGDMGYLNDGELYVTGRIKEIIIIRGQNIYPYDIERTCNQYEHAAGTTAAFSIDVEGREGLAVLVEIKKSVIASVSLEIIEADIRAIVMERHQIAVSKLLPVKPGTIPRTTSGKIQRTKCKEIVAHMCATTVESA